MVMGEKITKNGLDGLDTFENGDVGIGCVSLSLSSVLLGVFRFMLLILTGLSAGALHVLSGPDHLAVVAPLVAEKPSKGLQLGFKWGLGHGLGVSVCQGRIPVSGIPFWAGLAKPG